MKKSFGIIILLTYIVLFIVGCGKSVEGTDDNNGIMSIVPEKVADAPEPKKVTSWNVTHTELDASYELAAISNDQIYGCSYTEDGLLISILNKSTGEKLKEYKTEVEGLGLFPMLKAFFADDNGYYYLWYEMSVPCAEVYEDGEEDIYTVLDRIYVKDQNMNTICYEQVPDSYLNKLVSLLFDEQGNPLLLAQDADGYYTRKIRTEIREEYEKCRIEEAAFSDQGPGNHVTLTEEGLLYVRDGAMYLYHMEERREEKLLELSVGGIYEEDIICLGAGQGIIEVINNYPGGERSEYTRFEQGESTQVKLTIGVMTLQSDLRDVITEFNRKQDHINIEPIVYVEGMDYDAGYEKLKLDVVQGKAPDLISTYGIDYESLANKGAFADLYEFMEEDSEFSRELLVSSVAKAYEMEEHLYTVAPAFLLHTVWGGSSLVKGRYGVDMNEWIEILRENGGNINSIYGFSADESVLRTLCSLGMGKFINWQDGSCDFTNEEFYQILEFAKEYQGTPFESLYEAVRDKEILLTLGLITSVEDYCLESELFGETVEFIGYPTVEGTGTVAGFLGNALAVNAKSELMQEAWEFIKYYLEQGYDGRGFPVLQEQFEDMLAESMKEKVIEENGQCYKVAKKSYTEREIVSIQIYKTEKDDVEAVRKLVEKISGKFQYYNIIQNIIGEEAEGYFAGHKELQDIAAVIENRVGLYLQELQ